MSKKNFILLSLEDNKAKKIANAVSNPSCKKILDFLSENEATETQISEKLKIPISTVHYNLQQLLESKLIDWDKYHYSEKGKEVRHYKIANKYIIIAPKGEDTNSLMERLKTILPSFFLVAVGALAVYFLNKPSHFAAASLAEDNLIEETPLMMAKGAELAVAEVAPRAIETTNMATSFVIEPYLWFIIGAITMAFSLLSVWLVRKKVFKK